MMDGFKESEAVIDFMYNEMMKRKGDPKVDELRESLGDLPSRAANLGLGFTNHSVAQLFDGKNISPKKATKGALGDVYKDFIETVGNGKDWDFKPQLSKKAKKYYHKKLLNKKGTASTIFGTPIPGDYDYILDYDTYSNVHYGYAGSMVLTRRELVKGSEAHDREMGHKFSSAKEHSSSPDTRAVKLGIKIYNDFFKSGFSKSDFINFLLWASPELNRWKRSDLIEAEHVVEAGDTLVELSRVNNLPIEAILMVNKGLKVSAHLRAGQVIRMPTPDEMRAFFIKRDVEKQNVQKILNSPQYLWGQGIMHERLVQKMQQHFVKEEEEKRPRQKIDKEFFRMENGETLYYIWETSQDSRVRSAHAARHGRVFCRTNPPEDGNPGEKNGCRCKAIPYYGNDLVDWDDVKADYF